MGTGNACHFCISPHSKWYHTLQPSTLSIIEIIGPEWKADLYLVPGGAWECNRRDLPDSPGGHRSIRTYYKADFRGSSAVQVSFPVIKNSQTTSNAYPTHAAARKQSDTGAHLIKADCL